MMNKMVAIAVLVVSGAAVSACSDLPRVVVLHDPLTPEQHVTLGLTYEMEGRPELAAREYNAALQQQQAYVPALIGLGNLAFDRGAVREAEAFYRQALATDPEDPGANNNLAMIYATQGEKLEEAERLASLALAQGGPLQPYVLDTIAHIYAQQGRYREARMALNNAEALAPAYDRALHQRLAQLQQELAVGRSRSEQRLEWEF